MVRRTEVQYQQVADACTMLFRAGETVSFPKVYLAIGSKGGQQVVSDMIRRWKQETAEVITATRENIALPADLVKASDDLVEAVWKLASARAEESYQQKSGELAMKESEWQATLEKSAARVEAVERENLAIQAEVASCKATLIARDETIAELEVRLREAQASLAARDDQVTALREDLARTVATMESERSRHDELLQAAQAQHEAAVQKGQERHAAALAKAHDQADADRRHFLQQTDDMRQAHRAQADSLREQLDGQRVQAETFRRQAYEARDEASRWQGKCELLQSDLADARRILGKVQRHRDRKAGGHETKAEPAD